MLKRSFTLHIKSAGELSGYAFKYSETASGFYGEERFSPSLKVEYAEPCLLLRDHNPERLLARKGQNLSIKTDESGLYFEVSKLPETLLAKETKTLIKDQVLTGASVGFMPTKERKDGKVNVFENIRLYEISIVPSPYYTSSKVDARHNPTLKHRLLPPELYL